MANNDILTGNMMNDTTVSAPEFLSGGGELGRLMRETDWSATPLGEVAAWPQSLRTCVRIMLNSRQPIWIGWGRDLIKLYNDPYRAIVGGKHPWALGKPASVVWKEIWKDIGPMLQQVMEGGESIYTESQLLIMERNGYPEETYYTFSYTSIPGDEGEPAGIICANTDDTDRIISERRLKTLTELGKRLTDARTEGEVIEKTIAVLGNNPHDFPFTLLYTATGPLLRLSHHSDLGDAMAAVPAAIDLRGGDSLALALQAAAATRQPQVLERLADSLGPMPRGAWQTAPSKAIVLPVVPGSAREPAGFLVIGLNPYRLLNEKYLGIFSLIADQVATSFGNVHTLEEERKRAEALAEIDRAKTIFFSNISHEFRTPLTLLMGPIEDTLQEPGDEAANRSRMEVAWRNALRMQKLVNTLLDFSKIESGRMEGVFSRVDIGALTRELAGVFRSAIERAGMSLVIDCRDIRDEVYVDVDMWEKIVLNLVSNAFKYTKQGTIGVEVMQVGDQVRVSVSDTGAGIPASQLDKIFDRFHRVENTAGRSQEGTGIGLAMVRELVKLHYGTIGVSSREGEGSVFTVTLPVGRDHLPADKVHSGHLAAATSIQQAAFMHEALKWTPSANGEGSQPAGDEPTGEKKYKVLLADDNADMRDYVGRLLRQQFEVITAADGEEALQKALAHKPDLLLSDIMMPKLDGLGLLAALRGHPDIKNTPVILLSARAGEEAKVEGLLAGADDYLVKPFPARELLARVDTNIRINIARQQFRQELEEQVRQRTGELQASNNDLQQFAHVASHDLKEPTRKIKTFTKMLQRDPASRFSDKAQVYLGKINAAAERMSSMIEGVLNYSMLNAMGHRPEPVDLNNTLGAIVSDLELLAQEKSASIRYAGLPTIEGAEVLLYQLFYNLINNSLKFARADTPAEIAISSVVTDEEGGSFARILLTDNGIGFEPEQSEKIFETFLRLNPKDQYEGTGLGLSLCKKIVERHGGSIEASGQLNNGAVFIIRLPLKQQRNSI